MDFKQFITEYPDFPQPGVNFKDISPLLENPYVLISAADAMFEPFIEHSPDKIVALESRGFIFGSTIATKYNVGFIMVRKPGKLPGKKISASYSLEYGENTFELQLDRIQPGERIVIVDDVLATGGSALAAKKLVEQCGAELLGFAFFIELDALKGREKLAGYEVNSVVHY